MRRHKIYGSNNTPLVRIFLLASALLFVWIAIASLVNIDTSKYNLVPVVLLIVVSFSILVPRRWLQKLVISLRSRRSIVIFALALVTVVAVVARFGLLYFPYQPTPDPGTFFQTASTMATSGKFFNPGYAATFPYLISYDLLLAAAMHVFGAHMLTTIMLNTAFDILSAGLLFFFIRAVTGSALWGATSGVLWLSNPLLILFSALSLPIAAVNAFIILSICLVYLLLKKFGDTLSIIIVSLFVGLTFGLANVFRPFMAVFIIALGVYFLITLISKWSVSSFIRSLICLLIIVSIFSATSLFHKQLTYAVTNIVPASNAAGWSVYVGSNTGSSGKYNLSDARKADDIYQASQTLSQAQDRFLQLGLERYGSYSPVEVADLIVRKSLVLLDSPPGVVYDVKSYPLLWNNTNAMLVIFAVCAIFLYGMIVLGVYYAVSTYRGRDMTYSPIINYLWIAFIGLFLASLLTEVSGRYFAPFYVFLTIFATLGLHRLSSSRLVTPK